MKNPPKISQDKLDARLVQELPSWEFCLKHNAIERDFERENFVDCVAFISKIAEAAEAADHHPDLLLHDYKFVRVMLSTHSAGGVTENDFQLASVIESLQRKS